MQFMAKNLRKAQQRLQARIDSFESNTTGKAARPSTGVRRPGSMNRHKS